MGRGNVIFTLLDYDCFDQGFGHDRGGSLKLTVPFDA